MATNHYDVIVCGAELGGLVAAALLGRRGLRVLLVGHDREPPGFDAGPLKLSRGPALLPPLESAPVARVLEELGLVQVMRRRAPQLAPGFEVVMPSQRFLVSADRAHLRRELERVWPADVRALDSAVNRLGDVSALLDPLLATPMTLPADGFWERREVARVESLLPRAGSDPLTAAVPPQHPFRAVAIAAAALWSGFGPGDIGAVTLARAFEHQRRGLHCLEGGQVALWNLFLGKIETFSGERMEGAVPVEIVQRRGRATGLRVRPRDEIIGCDALVWAGSLASAAGLLVDRADRAESATKVRPKSAHNVPRPAYYRYTLALLLAAGDGTPGGMSQRMFLLADPARPLLEENAMVVTVGQPSARHPDRVPAWVECLVPAAAVEAGPGHLRALRTRMRAQLPLALPSFEQRLMALGSAYDGLPVDVVRGPAEGIAPPAVQPIPAIPAPLATLAMPALHPAGPPRVLDVSGVPHAALGVKGMFIVGRENLPGLGLEGELVAAWGLARLLTTGHHRRERPRPQILAQDR